MPQLLQRTAFDLDTVLEYVGHYGIEESFPCLLLVDALLAMPAASRPHYQVRPPSTARRCEAPPTGSVGVRVALAHTVF